VQTLSIWWDTIQSNIDTYLVRGRVNALVDSGPPQFSVEPMAAALKGCGLTPAAIGAVLNTHGHIDHIGGNAIVKAAGNAKIYIHRDDAVFLENHSLSFDRFYAVGKEHDLERQKAGLLGQLGPELPADCYLGDNDQVALGEGIDLRVIHLPGHTPGSCGYYWEGEDILFAGDSIQGINTPGGFLPILWDCVAYEKSLQRLQSLPIRALLLSHPYRGIHLPPSLVREGTAVKEYLADSLLVAQTLGEALRTQVRASQGRSLAETADSVIASLPKEWGFKPLAELPMPDFSLGTVAFALAQFRGATS
jgi:glyoxylase-like metal-dependent hydrolase (beta-lactamase superfamily II)